MTRLPSSRALAAVALAAAAGSALSACASSAASGTAERAAVAPAAGGGPATAAAPARTYEVLVASEATDRIALVEFGPQGTRVTRQVKVGIMLMDPDGPHGLAVSPDRRFYYVSTAHGTPYGWLWKYDAQADTLAGRVQLGNFPATLQLTPDGALAFVVNFNLHGEMVPSSVSVVSTDEMVEVARIPTCTMPHGSRLNGAGTKHYSACMMDDMLVEIDVGELGVSRHFMLAKGQEHGEAGPPHATGHHAAGDHGGHGETTSGGGASCSPTWAQPTPDGSRVFVACNKSSEIVEVDVAKWQVVRRLPAGDGVYNLAITSDGRTLVATNKRSRSISIVDAGSGAELARIPTLRRVVHGVAISPDDRYAFVSVEGVGSEPGTVEVIDLRARQRVASADVGQMAGGIDVLRVRE